jgi:hypothetical protein
MDVRLLKQLVQLNLQQELYALPSTPDIHFPALKQNRVHTFAFTYDAGTISAAVAGTSAAFTVALSSFPTATLFAGFFDTYRIQTVKIMFNPISSVLTTGTTAPITTAVDYDDATASVNLSDRDTAMTVPSGRYFERIFMPRAAQALYGGAFTSFGQTAHPWIDTANPGVLHYGLKYTQGPSTAVQPLWDVQVRAIVQGKNNF